MLPHQMRKGIGTSNLSSDSLVGSADSVPSSSPLSPGQRFKGCSDSHLNESSDNIENNAPSPSSNSQNSFSSSAGNSEPEKGDQHLHMKDHDIEAISSLLMLKGPAAVQTDNSSSTQSEELPLLTTSKQRDVTVTEESRGTRTRAAGNGNKHSSTLNAIANDSDSCCHKCAKYKANNYKKVHNIIRIQTKKYDSWRKNKDRLMRSKDFRTQKGYLELDKKQMNSVLTSLSKYHGKGETSFIPFQLHHDIDKLSESTVGMTKTSKWEQIETRRKEREKEKILSKQIDTSFPQRVMAVSSLLKKVDHDHLCQSCKTRYEIGLVPYILKRTIVTRPEHGKVRFDPCAHFKSTYKELSAIHVHGMLTIGAEFGITFPLPTGFTKLQLNESTVKRKGNDDSSDYYPYQNSSPYTRDSVNTNDIEGTLLRKTKRLKNTMNEIVLRDKTAHD